MAAGGHLGSPIWAILDDRKSLDRISRHFKSIRNFNFLDFFPQNGCRRPFWMTENHFRSHFSPFQINTQLLFFSQNGCQRPFWMTENHFWSHFSPFQINTQLLFLNFFFTKWLPAAILEVPFGPFWMTENHFLSHFSPFQINIQLLFLIFFQNGRQRPFCFSDWWQKSYRVLVIWDLNGYGEYEFDRYICDKVMACTSVGVRRRRRRRNKNIISPKFSNFGDIII